MLLGTRAGQLRPRPGSRPRSRRRIYNLLPLGPWSLSHPHWDQQRRLSHMVARRCDQLTLKGAARGAPVGTGVPSPLPTFPVPSTAAVLGDLLSCQLSPSREQVMSPTSHP